MESATSPEFFPPLDRPVDRLDAMTRRVNSSRADTWARMKASSLLSLWLVDRPSRASRPLQQLRDTSCASSWWSPRRGRVHAAPAFGRSIHSAGLGGRRHRCGFAWVPLSSSVDAWPSALWLSLGSFLLLPCFVAVLFSLCPHFPHASDLHLGSCLGLVLLVTASLLSLCAVSGLFSLFSLFLFDSRLGSSKLAAVAYRFFPRLARRIWSWRVRFYCGSLPAVPFSPLSSSSGQGGVALICLSCVFLVTVLGGKADCGRCSLDFFCVSRRGK
jgi:hypothetical protein